jgi:glycosyltransferase involved in cell wall biosynthesis
MKILHLTYTLQGGAGIAAYRQHKALRAAGIDSSILTVEGQNDPQQGIYSLQETMTDYTNVLRKHQRRKFIRNIKTRIHGNTPELFSDFRSVWGIEKHELIRKADIIHLHWVAEMIDLEVFFSSVTKPVVWTLHDAWAFTGGFHYEKYWDTRPFGRLSARGLNIRREIFRTRRAELIFPSQYLMDQCTSSGVFENSSFHKIDNCVDECYYVARQRSMQPKNNSELQILFASGELRYYRKGFDIVLSALNNGGLGPHHLSVIGSGLNPGTEKKLGAQFTAYEKDAGSMLKRYANADVLIHTSREDNQPNVVAESLCCGTPVIATPAGGVPEMIQNNMNGIILDTCSPEALCSAISDFNIRDYDRARIADEARHRYAPDKFAKSILKVYSEL